MSLSSVPDSDAPTSRNKASEDGLQGWVLLPPLSVPDRWRERGVPLILVPLLSEEAEAVLAGYAAEPSILEADQLLARCVARGLSIGEISRELGLSRRQVERRVAALRERFGVESKSALAAFFAQKGF